MTVEVHPFQAGLGADISGVDIREPLSTADRDRIRKAWLDNLVLRFRGMPMTDEQHMAFTGQFGALEYNPAKLIEKQYGVETQTAGRIRGSSRSRMSPRCRARASRWSAPIPKPARNRCFSAAASMPM